MGGRHESKPYNGVRGFRRRDDIFETAETESRLHKASRHRVKFFGGQGPGFVADFRSRVRIHVQSPCVSQADHSAIDAETLPKAPSRRVHRSMDAGRETASNRQICDRDHTVPARSAAVDHLLRGARAASGQAAAVPPSSVMNSRRFIGSPCVQDRAKCGFLLRPSEQEIATGEMGWNGQCAAEILSRACRSWAKNRHPDPRGPGALRRVTGRARRARTVTERTSSHRLPARRPGSLHRLRRRRRC